MNSVTLIGRTTKDIELRKTPNGKFTCSFTLAVNRRNKDDGADFITCVAWSKTAELLERYVKKGHRIAVSGRINTRSYESHGNTVYVTEVIADEIEFLESRREPRKATESAPEPQTDEYTYDAEYADKLPF